jgi:hypothetical protein
MRSKNAKKLEQAKPIDTPTPEKKSRFLFEAIDVKSIYNPHAVGI